MQRKHFKPPLAILLSLFLVLSQLPGIVFATESDVVNLTIIHVNDRHGRMGADAYISQLAKGITGNILILDAGDTLHGQTATNLSKGEAMVEVMNAVGYSAMVPGNHDFNFGVVRLIELSEMMNFPLLAANIKTTDSKKLFKPYEIFKLDGITVGIFGLATPVTVTATAPRNIAGLTFEDPAKTAAAMVATLKAKGCDIIIALVHMGMNELSDSVHRSNILAKILGIDVIIDGHCHTALKSGLFDGDTLIAQAGEHGRYIGIVEITMTGENVTKTARLLAVNEELTADEDIVSIIDNKKKKFEYITNVVVGNTPVKLDGRRELVRTSETNLANIISDSVRHATASDIAFINGGSIRESIKVGDITMGQILTVLPFSNLIVTVELTGDEIINALEHGVSLYPQETGQHIQVSGISFLFDPEAEPGTRVVGVKLEDGSALGIDKTYTVATIDFMVAGGAGYDMLKNGRNLVYYGGDAEVLADYLVTNPIINAEPEGRVTTVNNLRMP